MAPVTFSAMLHDYKCWRAVLTWSQVAGKEGRVVDWQACGKFTVGIRAFTLAERMLIKLIMVSN